MRRKTRPRVVWLPNDTLFSIDSAGANSSTYSRAFHDIIAINSGDAVISTHPVVIDKPADPLATTTSLSDVESSGYRLRRIVGKIYCGIRQASQGPFGPTPIICTAAFIILRVNPLGTPINPDIESYGPNIVDTNDSPWIWRRSWLLADRGQNTSEPFQGAIANSNNFFVGGVADGPHIDAKTARIVSQDERLFLVLSSTAVNPGSPDIISRIEWLWDPRVLATMRTTSGNRRNASR